MRGSGRTRAMVMGLPAGGATVIVHTQGMKRYVLQMIYDLRPDVHFGMRETDIRVVSSPYDAFRLHGCRQPLVMDHAFVDLGLPDMVDYVRALGGVETPPPRRYDDNPAGETERAFIAARDRFISDAMTYGSAAMMLVDPTMIDEVDFRPGAINYLVGLSQQVITTLLYGEGLPRSAEAKAKADKLLREWLSPEQAAELDAAGHFHVHGCHSQRRYRIERGTVQNVFRVDKAGRKVAGWCFAPEGALAEGDVMLAQKIALETDELGALERANKFDPDRLMLAPETRGGPAYIAYRGIPIRVVDSLLSEPPVT